MARNRSTESAPKSEATETAPEEQTQTEAPEEQATDLAPITALAEESLSDADEFGVPNSTEALVAAYRDLDVKGKRAFREITKQRAMHALMEDRDANQARGWKTIENAVTTAPSKSTAAPVDPTEAFVLRGTAYALASRLVMSEAPEGVDLEAAKQSVRDAIGALDMEAVSAYQTWLGADSETRGDEPEVSQAVKVAVNLASGKAAKIKTAKSGRVSSGVRRDIAAHLSQVFSDVPSGTFLTVAEIVGKRSDEYGDDKPSPGAVSARLFPDGKLNLPDGIVPVEKTSDSPRGARKV